MSLKRDRSAEGSSDRVTISKKRRHGIFTTPRNSGSITGGGRHSMNHRTSGFPTQLPVEILDEILTYVIPDLNSSAWNEGPWSTPLIHPLLQTNRALRLACLAFIHRRTLWIRVETIDECLARCLRVNLSNLHILPPNLTHLVQSDAAEITLHFKEWSHRNLQLTRSIEKKTFTLRFPFNFDRLIYFTNVVDDLAGSMRDCYLNVVCQHVAARFQRQIYDLVIPLLSVLRNIGDSQFEMEGTIQQHFHIPRSLFHRGTELKLDKVTEEAQDIVNRIQKLTDNGYEVEAGLLALANYYLLTWADENLPNAPDWVIGEIEANILPFVGPDTDFPVTCVGRCPLGNQLRSLIHKIEYRARLAMANFVSLYGRPWWHNHHWMFYDGHDTRFLEGPVFGWFGLSVSESVELYYSRALCEEAMGKAVLNNDELWITRDKLHKLKKQKRGVPELSYIQRRHIEEAATFMFFARMLDPNNDEIRTVYRDYKKLLGLNDAKRMEFAAMARFRIETDETGGDTDPLRRRVLWSGDDDALDLWGGNEMLQFLPLARKGLTASGWMEWGSAWFNRNT